MGESGDFIAQERQIALNVRDALRQCPVRQVIFLSSLQAKGSSDSSHLIARQLTGDILRDAGVPVTELRAGIIVGAGSAAFEVMRDMVYNLPVLTPPLWVRSRTTPLRWRICCTICWSCATTRRRSIAFSRPPARKR
jgi:uncharacterized protein YbjT (DUF2867 family)